MASTRRSSTRSKKAKRWSQRVTETSDAMDLEAGVFKSRSAKAIASSLKRYRPSEASGARPRLIDPPCRCSASTSTAVENSSPPMQRQILERAKGELKALFGRA